MSNKSFLNESVGFIQAPHLVANEMISFRKSVDKRPSRSVLNSPSPYASNSQLVLSEAENGMTSTNTNLQMASAVDKYTSIGVSDSRAANGGSFFDTADIGETYTNSVYETIMNTKNKDWFQRPARYEVPQVKLIVGENTNFMKSDDWKKELKGYLNIITPIFEKYESLSRSEYDYVEDKEDEIPLFLQQAEFDLDDDYYLDNIKVLERDEENGKALLQRLEHFLQRVDIILKKQIDENKDSFNSIRTELENIQQKLRSFEELVQVKIDTNKKFLATEVVKEENLILLELRLKNVCKLEAALSEVETLTNNITALCDEYHGELEKTPNMLPFSSLNSYMNKIHLLESEMQQNILFEEVSSLRETKTVLLNLKLEIGGKILLQFVQILDDDLDGYKKKNFSDNNLILSIMNDETSWPDVKFDEDFKLLLKEYVAALSASDSLINAYQMYCDKIINKCRELVKQKLPKPNEKETVVLKMSQLIRNMSASEFEYLVEFVFCNGLIYFKRLYEQQKLLLDLGLNALDNSKLDTNVFLKLDIRSGINESIRIIQLRMSKIINCRSDLHAVLDFESFLKLRLNMCNFSRRCEQLTGEILTLNLNDVIVAHTEEFQKILGSRLKKRLKTFIEQKEDWLPVVVDPKIQKYVNEIFLSSEIIPDEWLVDMKGTDSPENVDIDSTGTKKSIIVNNKTFVASNSLIEMIKIIREFMIVAYNLPVKYCNLLENSLIKTVAEFDRFSLLTLLANPSILNSQFVGTNSVVPLNNLDKLNVNSVIFKNNQKNYTILSEALECIRELLLPIQHFFSNRDKQSNKIIKTANTISYRTGRAAVGKLYDNLLINYQNSATLVYKCSIPPPDETTAPKVSSLRSSLEVTRESIQTDVDTEVDQNSVLKEEDDSNTQGQKNVIPKTQTLENSAEKDENTKEQDIDGSVLEPEPKKESLVADALPGSPETNQKDKKENKSLQEKSATSTQHEALSTDEPAQEIKSQEKPNTDISSSVEISSRKSSEGSTESQDASYDATAA